MMIGFVRKLIVIFTLTFASTYANAIEVVKYIANNSGVAEDYYLEVLETALKITEPKYGAYRIDFTHEQLSSERKHDLLIAGERLNIDRIVSFHQPTGRRSALLYINVPLLRGFMGYRIALIRSQSQARFDQVNNLNDLKKISLGLGKGWEGYIYKENGFTVNEPLTFDSLLKMLAGKRYDFVPLSVIEIEDTYDIDPEPIDKLVPEQHLLIHTELPNYFYVSPQVPILAERLTLGLKTMQENGSLNKIFEKHFSARLKRLDLKHRKIIEVPNSQDDGSLKFLEFNALEKY